MSTTSEIRNTFLNYFKKNGHEVVSSSPLVPHNDPTLMFTNAGMVQFKNVFTGAENRSYKRATTSQKCVRAGGKHNDLDNVGYTARHHTFFEMLGNFSFGDYFKSDAIPFAWELLTKDFALDKNRLYITVYHTDDEAYDIWKKIVSEDRIFRIPTSDNFWQMGDTGPCGPCSEIYYNFEKDAPKDITNAGDDCVEIWNLVFMQFEQFEGGERKPLPKPSIDTGMGLERISAVLQGVRDNYEIDLFRKLIEASVEKTGRAAEGAEKPSHRVIADHLRASVFLIADGVMPSNEGRGYVLRRIMRRAMRHAHILGAKEPLMHRLVPTLVTLMGEAYPEIVRAQSLATEVLKLEEERFKATLERGLKLLDEQSDKIPTGGTLDGEVAFKLYDTYGFPVDLTADILRGQNKQVDQSGFEKAMERQKAEARKAWSGSGAKATDRIWFDLRDKLGATEFLGYSVEKSEAVINGIVIGEKEATDAKTGDEIFFSSNQTCFYGESGGQMGDTGTAKGKGFEIEITDTIKPLSDFHIHVGKVTKGTVKVGEPVELTVDHARRTALRANHSATHILHKALRKVLGTHVTQKGSMVAADRMRFDFSHPKAVSKEELQRIEDEVNLIIRQNTTVHTKLMNPEDAVKAGAMALFGEKYGDEVRVVSMGIEGDDHYSVELCGGTHVHHTGDIGLLRIVGESSVSAGVRRIEGLTATGALADIRKADEVLTEVSQAMKSSKEELKDRVTSLMEDKKKLEREVAELKKQVALGGGGGAGAKKEEIENINGISFIGKIVDDLPAKDLRGLVDELKKQAGSGIVTVISKADGKASLVIGVTKDIMEKISAVELVHIATPLLGGQGGGGRPDMAQSGGPDASKASEVMDSIREYIKAAA